MFDEDDPDPVDDDEIEEIFDEEVSEEPYEGDDP